MIKFVEAKAPDLSRVSSLLTLPQKQNQWANRGPLYNMLSDKYAMHFNLDVGRKVTPCANGGVALEAMSRLLGQRAGRAMRWVGSAFSFQNLGRGHFADMRFVDCTAEGLLDLDELRKLPADSFDGLVVVNPFGLFSDFSAYIDYAQNTNKALLIDNAAGVHSTIPDWPWQAFSLHHTKPYGMGEGGLALTPSDAAEDLYALLDYGPPPERPADWLNNGKISDISCAFLIDRLEQAGQWVPRYHAQVERVHGIAREVGLHPIRPFAQTAPATSWAFKAEGDIPLVSIRAASRINFVKYYKPLRPLPRTVALFDRLLNIPTHPDVEALSDADLREELELVLSAAEASRQAPGGNRK